MNLWTELSIEYANQRSYLDDLFAVYPKISENVRVIDQAQWRKVETAFLNQDNLELVLNLLTLQKFTLENSYISSLRKDEDSLLISPQKTDRLADEIYELGLAKLYEKCIQSKEKNTPIGLIFNHFLQRKILGIIPVSLDVFLSNNDDAILGGNDTVLLQFANQHFGYNKEKGLDFVARFNGKYILGEVKFITDIGENQDESFVDFITTLNTDYNGAIYIGINGFFIVV